MGCVAQALSVLPGSISCLIEQFTKIYGGLQEIRLRVNEWIILICDGREYVLEEKYGGKRISVEQINECFKRICEYSAYAYEEEMKQGYITIGGGHRVGIAGKVINYDGQVRNIRNVTYLNIRIASQIKGCADRVLEHMYEGNKLMNTLIVSPPGGGKTTLLRDIIRQVSDGNRFMNGITVGVVDERSEICACYRGVPQNDVGMRTDVLDGCPKAEGIIRLIRSMSPRAVAVDEIGTDKDINAIEYAAVSGCSIIATVHGNDIEDISNNPILSNALVKGLFKRYVILFGIKSSGRVKMIRDDKGRILYAMD